MYKNYLPQTSTKAQINYSNLSNIAYFDFMK
ncbi:hypothetical protein S091751_0939 [Staphylococcus aureus subsp. aureus 091751]|nr:hypothetical protein Newbould305_2635 [Staphylococcus aureus subsp. aureus str. Newbould 305]EOR35258.1 hypothetical protein S091751_0939 [Staphylococcus aureus subsp. aureus 091751]EOR36563.1 hypothetical protein S103564_0612 [Staphylococcus aureus subsp. aureus 103564]